MFCQNCGTQNEDNSLFCISCGAKLDVTPAVPVAEAPAATPVAPAQPAQPAQPVAPAQSVAQPAAPKVKSPLPLKSIIITAVELVIAIVAIIVFFVVGNKMFSPANAAKSFYNAMAAGDFSKAYGYMNVGEGNAFLSEESFIAAFGDDASDYEFAQVLAVQKMGDQSNVSIRVNGESQTVRFISAGRKFLVFKDWRVSVDSFVVKDCYIYAPKDFSVYLDGVLLTNGKEEDNRNVYEVKKIFKGDHEIAPALGDVRGGATTYSFNWDDDYYTIYDFTPSPEMYTDAANVAYNAFTTMADAYVGGKDFNTVKDIYSKDAVSYAKTSYEDNTTYNSYSRYYAWNKQDTREGVYNLEVKDVRVDSLYGRLSDNKLYITCELRYNYTYTYLAETYNWDIHQYQLADGTQDGSGYTYIYLVYEDGQWKVSETLTPSFYFYY